MTMQPATLVAITPADLNDSDDRARIDDHVRAHPDATPFHLTGWNVAVARACGQTAHCLIAEAADGEIVGVLPLTEIRSPLFGKALVSAGFAVDGGILTRRDGRRGSAGGIGLGAGGETRLPPASNCAAGRRRARGGWSTTPLISASRATWRRTTTPNCSRSRASNAPRCASRSTAI